MKLPNIRFVQIQTHSRCNASCLFCPWEESQHAAHPGVMTDEMWHHVLDCLRPFAKGINTGKVCFAGETLVATLEGDKPIRELVGRVKLLVPSAERPTVGTWREVEVRSFGRSRLLSLKLRRGRAEKTIRVTPDHRWVLRHRGRRVNSRHEFFDGDGFVRTAELKPGDRLASCYGARVRRDDNWTVVSVEDNGEEDEVFCAVVPSVEQFALADNLRTGNCPYLMQEPLIDKKIFQRIEDIYAYFPQTLVEISTNGAALTEKTVDRLYDIWTQPGRRHEIWVSHHGIDKETFTHIMQIDYERATKNLLYLLRKSDGKLRIKIRGAGESRDGKHTYFTRQQYIDYWTRRFAEEGINTTNVSLDAFTFHDRAGTLHRQDRNAYKLNVGKVREIGPGHKPFYCPRLDQWIHIMYDGRIRLCCMDYHGEVELPSLADMTLVEYFQSPYYSDLVARVTGKKASAPNFICKRCISPGG